MGDVFRTRGLWELVKQLESDDDHTVQRALLAIRSIPQAPTRLSLLEHAARHCGSPELAAEAFETLCEELEPFTAEEKAGQVEDIIRYGSKVLAIRHMAMRYAVELVERGELDQDDRAVQSMLQFIAQAVSRDNELFRKATSLIR